MACAHEAASGRESSLMVLPLALGLVELLLHRGVLRHETLGSPSVPHSIKGVLNANCRRLSHAKTVVLFLEGSTQRTIQLFQASFAKISLRE